MLIFKARCTESIVVNGNNNNLKNSEKDLAINGKGKENNSYKQEVEPRTSNLILPDKVYTFTPQDNVETLDSVFLEKKFTYYIYIELVTPHNVSYMRITVWDPDDRIFTLFESEMFYEPEYGRYFEIPFGTSEVGGHKFEFFANVDQNFNMLIRIEQGQKCLHDKMDAQEVDNLLLHKVNTFDDGAYIEHDVRFETDKSYKFYMGRVSAISIDDDNEVRMDYIILDPYELSFQIYIDEEMTDIDGVNSFSFGTSIEGIYTVEITIRCEVYYVNIAYAIVDDYEISDVIDVDETNPDNDDEDNDDNKELNKLIEEIWNNSTYLPGDWVVGTLIFFGSIMGCMTIALIYHRRKNKVNINLRKKRNRKKFEK